MLRYLVVEIAGRQYKVSPGEEFLVDNLGDLKALECDKVLLKAEEDGLKVGTPYLNEKVVFEVIENLRGEKIRVATYHAKANTRKVKGSRRYLTKLRFADKTEKKAKEETVEKKSTKSVKKA